MFSGVSLVCRDVEIPRRVAADFIYLMLLFISYFQISRSFEYLGFYFATPSLGNTVIGALATLLTLSLNLIKSAPHSRLLGVIFCYLIVYPAIIVFIQNPAVSRAVVFVPLLFYAFFMISIRAFSYRAKPPFTIGRVFSMAVVIALAAIISLTWGAFSFERIFQDVYALRSDGIEIQGPKIIGYMFSAVVRVFLPVLAIYGIVRRSWGWVVLSAVGVTYCFALDGLKSVLFGYVLAVVFAFAKSIEVATWNVRVFFISLAALAVLEDFYSQTYVLNDFFLRRVLFYPSVLSNYFYDFFEGAPLLLGHVLGYATAIPDGVSVSQYVGDVVMPIVIDPSTGVYVDGFVNGGYFGVMLWGVAFGIIMTPLVGARFAPHYTGLIFYYLYLANTSFLPQLLLSHSLFVFVLVVAMFRIKRTRL